MRRKTYKVTTFEEMRKQMREAEARRARSAAKEPDAEQPPKNDGKEMEVDFDVKNTGQTKAINGFDTRQVIATITVREKGKKIEESGGIVMTVDTWLSKSAPSLKEIADFERRYWEKLAGPMTAVDAQQMATVAGHVPGRQGCVRALQQGRPRRHRHSVDDDDGCGEERRADEAAGVGRGVGVERREGESAVGRRRASAASCAGASSRIRKRKRRRTRTPTRRARRS